MKHSITSKVKSMHPSLHSPLYDACPPLSKWMKICPFIFYSSEKMYDPPLFLNFRIKQTRYTAATISVSSCFYFTSKTRSKAVKDFVINKFASAKNCFFKKEHIHWSTMIRRTNVSRRAPFRSTGWLVARHLWHKRWPSHQKLDQSSGCQLDGNK